MAWTQADLDALLVKIASVGAVKATTIEDQSTTFRDIDELLKLKAVMEQEINASRSSTRYVSTSKGV